MRWRRGGGARLEGPFGNHTGTYVPAAAVPVFRLQAITRRRKPLYPATIIGPPPTENCIFAQAIGQLLLPLLRIDCPEVVDFFQPAGTIFHGCALVSARVDTGSGRDLLHRLRRSELLRRSRLLVLFSEEVDVRSPALAWWQAINRVDPGRDLLIEAGWIGVDATRPQAGVPVVADPSAQALVERRWREYGID